LTEHTSSWHTIRNFFLLAHLSLTSIGCSPSYVIKAGLAELEILSSRRPIIEVIQDTTTTKDTRSKLVLVSKAREFASETLQMNIGTSYTTFTKLDRDTLALILSASPKDQLEPKTWWFPLIGRFPYRGFFDKNEALVEKNALENEGFDTYLRPTSAFSTLGWFSDPILSTFLRQDEVGIVETVLHELSHNHLFIKGHIDFNESFATFVGRYGAVEFYCANPDFSPENILCLRAKARLRDHIAFEEFFFDFIKNLQALYQNSDLNYLEKLTLREELFNKHLGDFIREVQPTLEAMSYQNFVSIPINNATLLAQIRYHSRLDEFARLMEEKGGLTDVISYIKGNTLSKKDPFSVLVAHHSLSVNQRAHLSQSFYFY